MGIDSKTNSSDSGSKFKFSTIYFLPFFTFNSIFCYFLFNLFYQTTDKESSPIIMTFVLNTKMLL